MRISPRLLMPLLLAATGVAILIGCIPIPSPRWSQSDGRPRPEHFVGNSSKKSVWIGHTRIDDAFIELSRRVGPQRRGSGVIESVGPELNPQWQWSLKLWRVSPDRRQFAISYT